MTSFEQHPYFPSGDWEGFYNDPRDSGRKGDMTMTLNFSSGSVTGSGSDPVGVYTWTGTYDTKAETCSLRKTYAGAHSVEYSGYADENGIWGKWNIRKLTAGDFHIWPKKQGAGTDDEEVQEAVMKRPLILSLFLVLLTFLACRKNSSDGLHPVITGIFPDSGPYNTTLTIYGRNFYSTPLDNSVMIDSVLATVLQASPDSLVVTVPVTGTGPVAVTTDRGPGTGPVFNYRPNTPANGKFTGVPSSSAFVQSNAIAAYGSNIYVAGTSVTGYSKVHYWINGVDNQVDENDAMTENFATGLLIRH